MALDNTRLNPGSGGDLIRTLDRTGTGAPKTEVVQLDLGGPDPNAEKLIQAGQQTMANSVPVAIASDQGAVPVSGTVTANQGGVWSVTLNGQPISITGTISLSGGTGPQPSSQSTSVVIAPDQVVPVTTRDPVQIVNPIVSDTPVPIIVVLTASDINNIVNAVTVTGAVTAAQGAPNTTPWNENVAQFGGAAVVTGPGVSGAGIPRVTVSNDSVISGITNPVTVTGSLSFAGTGPQPSAQSTSVVVAPDQVVPTTIRDPVQIINLVINDQVVPVAVQLQNSDINNIVNPVTVANFPSVQPVSVAGPVSVTPAAGSLPSNLTQVNGAAPSAVNPIPVQLSNGVGFVDPSTLLAVLVQLHIMQLNIAAANQQSAAGFVPLEIPPMLGA